MIDSGTAIATEISMIRERYCYSASLFAYFGDIGAVRSPFPVIWRRARGDRSRLCL
ncbi:hypothetical protein CKA32_006865 [Geitlerinema sp. FC II]|nr:hypothetical protein CKA32_006865 [Geitlerinema sp. FC II]